MSGYFKSKCASWERFLSPTCEWQSRHSYLLSAWLSHCVISGSVLLTFRRVIVHRVGALLLVSPPLHVCFLSCLMYVYILVSSPLHVYFHVWCTCTSCGSALLGAFIYQNLFPSAPVCVSETVRSQCPVFSVTTCFHTGLYNGFASYIPQAS